MFSWTEDRRRWVACADTSARHHPSQRCEVNVGNKTVTSKPCTDSEKLEAQANLHKPIKSNNEYIWVAGVFGSQTKWCKLMEDDVVIKTRRAFCIGEDGIVSNDRMKDCKYDIPMESREVKLPICTMSITWHNSTWSRCDKPLDPCNGKEYRKTYCVDSTGAVLADKGACIRAGIPQPANQRFPCSICETKEPKDTISVPVYGLELDEQTLYTEYEGEFDSTDSSSNNHNSHNNNKKKKKTSSSSAELDSLDIETSIDHKSAFDTSANNDNNYKTQAVKLNHSSAYSTIINNNILLVTIMFLSIFIMFL